MHKMGLSLMIVAEDAPFPLRFEFDIEADVVIMALGTSPVPSLQILPKVLVTNRTAIVADLGATSRPGVFAGGDAVTGAATVFSPGCRSQGSCCNR